MGQFDEMDNTPMMCAVCEAMCPEAVDGTLTAAEQAAFDKHVAGCISCGRELEEAHRGAAWMHMLKGHTPEPPAALLSKILAETSGLMAAREIAVVAEPSYAIPTMPAFDEASAKPSRWGGKWTSFNEKMGEMFSLQSMAFSPRLAMTAAMAFFSLALTLNMAGVRAKDFRASSLRPSTIRRSVADAGASATRSFQNLRVVYEFESRVSDMRENGDLGKRYEENRQDSGTPFSGTEKDAPKQEQDQKQPEKQPQGRSALEFPLKRANITEKGA